jgi:imidazolonepropionase-like amidohydrolase
MTEPETPVQIERRDRTGARRYVLALFVCTVAAHANPLPDRHAIAITDVTIVDVEHARSFGPRTVLVDDGRIVAIDAPRGAHIPTDAQRVEGHGRFLIPGLVDMHVHLFNNASHRPPNDWTFPLFVANGVTAVREMNTLATSVTMVNRWRQSLDQGEIVAPRIVAAGVAVQGHTPAEAVAQVDAAADAGGDFIKVYSEIPAPNWRAVLDEARARSLPVAGHVPAGVSSLAAATAGQRSAEHLMQAYEACSSVEAQVLAERTDLEGDALVARRDAQEMRALAAFDARTCRRIGNALAATGQVQVPTLVLAYQESIRNGTPPSADPRWRYLRADERTRWERILASVPSHEDDVLAQRRWHVSRRIVSAFQRAHVPMLAGTDAPMPNVYPGYSLHEEMALLVASGLTPREALRSATFAPAQFLGLAATSGSVAVGKRADLVLLDADPTRDIRNTQRIDAVVLDGRLLRRAMLEALLDDAARPASAQPGR